MSTDNNHTDVGVQPHDAHSNMNTNNMSTSLDQIFADQQVDMEAIAAGTAPGVSEATSNKYTTKKPAPGIVPASTANITATVATSAVNTPLPTKGTSAEHISITSSMSGEVLAFDMQEGTYASV